MVFVVDDDATICRALERLLRSAGRAVESFPSAEAFLARTPAPNTGWLLVDVCMPQMSGPELQARLTARGSVLQVIFMSALDDQHVRASVLSAGARRFFSKPVDGEAPEKRTIRQKRDW